jgi:hypothetical protein
MPMPGLGRWPVITAVVCSAAVLLVAGRVSPQDDEKFERFLDLVESKYVPAPPGGKQTIKFKFNLSPDLPDGTKIVLQLLYGGLPIDGEQAILEVKGRQRTGVTFDFQPKKPLGPDDYHLQVTLDLKEQEAGVRKQLDAKPKVFPPRLNPFIYPFYEAAKEIKLGTEEERKAYREAICKEYRAFIDELIANWAEFSDTLEKVRAGEKHVKDGAVDDKALAKFIKDWRKKQAKTQKAIVVDFPEAKFTMVNQSRTAHLNLIRLAQMVSKRAWALQTEVEKQYGLKPINPAPDPKDKSDEVLNHFNRFYRGKVDSEELNRLMGRIEELVCPDSAAKKPESGAEGEEGEETGNEGAEGKKPAEGEKPAKGEKPAEGEKTPQGASKGESTGESE